MFLFSAACILANAEPFCEGLIGTGKAFGINEFFLVQWLAPLASETPEFVVAIMFSLRGQAGVALGSLLSAKLNQWTLLVGMIPGVFALSHGSLDHPIPMGAFQMDELLLTAAQSALAVLILIRFRFSVGQALLLFGLFVGQLISPLLEFALPGINLLTIPGTQLHRLFTLFYGIAAITLILDRPHRIGNLWQGFLQEARKSEE
jgi:cation:H+ antiporter